MKIRFLAASILFVAFSAHAEPASVESIEELLVTAKAEATVELMVSNVEAVARQSMKEMLDKSLQGKAPNAQQTKAIDDTLAKMFKVMREEMSWSSLKPMYVQIYQETFTQEEVDGVVAFQ